MTKTYEFTDFNQAWSFMSRSALLAEKVRKNVLVLSSRIFIPMKQPL
jgi:pterin-4a-carbinolamine dehydratase